ncbi:MULTISPECIES: DUF2273 domain-containing protein [Paenibacillus]|uniref:DUF2273 domain-containing protein n=1 Tax=Paenibacillus lutrae TaxID=2078573 RepID=A0A7X3FIK2_9BACL|nr:MULTISPECIES: DUF2273 domain-containing protein [Paenibacillus]MVP00154.1 DUF2273 domain-containing protein [Paenibacillus lutrae]
MLKRLWQEHPGTIAGAAGGLLLGLVYLIAGFWDMLIFAFIVFLGYYIGKKLDQGEDLLLPFQTLWQFLSQKWRMFR